MEKKTDITFLAIGLFITILVPVVTIVFPFNPSPGEIVLEIVVIAALDVLCFLAHKSHNRNQ